MKILLKIVGASIGVMFLLFGLVYVNNIKDQRSFGSIQDGMAYNSTTTKAYNGATIPSLISLRTTNGTLGSIVVGGATAGQQINLYDATTSSALLRTVAATTTLVSIPATALGGTYMYDVAFSNGLLLEVIGATGTSTITWR